MISVVIPAYNAEALISKCLDSLLKQTIDQTKYEIIVVDDGSTDATADVVQSFENVRLIKQNNQGPAAARNNGAANAKGDIILFTDSDCVPAINWIEEMIRPFNDDAEIVGVKGIYKTDQKELIARFVQAEYEDKYDVLKRDQYIDFVDTYSAGFKRKVFLEFGGYDTSFPVACAEDVELSFRMFSRGYKMVFNPNAVVSHRHPATLTGYLKKKYKFAFWRILAVRKNPNKIIKDSHTPQIMKLQLLFFPLLIISLLATIFYPRLIYLGFLVIAVFIISTIPFLKKVIKKDIAVGLLSPFLLMTRSVFQLFGVLNGTIQHIVIDNFSIR
jgi:GT2 family glycosyltransferase